MGLCPLREILECPGTHLSCATESSGLTGSAIQEGSHRMSNLMQEGFDNEHQNSVEVDRLSVSTDTLNDVDDFSKLSRMVIHLQITLLRPD